MTKKFKLLFTREFLKELKRIDRSAQIRILRELRLLEDAPYIGKRLHGALTRFLSLRIGDYRAIYEILNDKVIIRTVGHRKAVYKRFQL